MIRGEREDRVLLYNNEIHRVSSRNSVRIFQEGGECSVAVKNERRSGGSAVCASLRATAVLLANTVLLPKRTERYSQLFDGSRHLTRGTSHMTRLEEFNPMFGG
ncbi:hypothetical protein GJAV_G00133840 [Gymnothorax javanicus]|nr:hypothetical protein GJAV_G00133840 [Gymnothorax javanicus]